MWLDFFGRPAYTMTLAARLSETGATTLLTWGERLPQGRGYRIHFQPLTPPLSGTTQRTRSRSTIRWKHWCVMPGTISVGL